MCAAYVAADIKSVVDVVDGTHHFTIMDLIIGLIAGVAVIGLSCCVMQDAKRQLITILE